MSSPFGRLVAIVNPRAAKGRVREELPELERQLIASRLEYRFVEASAPGDATRAAREALDAGERYIVAVGGDDTVHEVVNGMVTDEGAIAPDAVLGVVAAGTGCDFVRTFGLPGDVIKAVRHLRGDQIYPIDVGSISYQRDGGGEARRFFANIAQVGLGASVARRSARLRRLGRSRYFFSFWVELLRHRQFFAQVRVDRKSFGRRANNVVIANGQYYGSGMRVSPRSYPGDGLLDIQVSIGPKSDAFRLIPKIYRGEHVPSPNVKELRGKVVIVDADRMLPVEADGEFLGATPATFSVVPQAIRLKV